MNAAPAAPSFPEVTLIVVTYQSGRIVPALAQCLQPFAHLIVVDNASTDGTPEQLRAWLPQAQLVCNQTNRGFGAANNQAVALADTPYVLLLNPDCSITAEALATLLQALQQYPRAGMVAPQAWRPNGDAQLVYRHAFHTPRKWVDYVVPEGICCAEWLAGCCWLVRTEAYRAIQGFDEGFFLYYEDDDFCLRMLQSGRECLLQPAAAATHVGGAGSRPDWRIDLFKHYHYALSRQRMIAKYQGRRQAALYQARTLAAALPAVPLFTLLLRKKHLLKWLGWGAAMLTRQAARTSTR